MFVFVFWFCEICSCFVFAMVCCLVLCRLFLFSFLCPLVVLFSVVRVGMRVCFVFDRVLLYV